MKQEKPLQRRQRQKIVESAKSEFTFSTWAIKEQTHVMGHIFGALTMNGFSLSPMRRVRHQELMTRN
jgi:hypothetical protein